MSRNQYKEGPGCWEIGGAFGVGLIMFSAWVYNEIKTNPDQPALKGFINLANAFLELVTNFGN